MRADGPHLSGVLSPKGVCGDTSVELTGQAYDGLEIVGEDDVRTVGCKTPKPKKKGKKK